MKILIVSDAWHPQINGVVRTLEATARELKRSGHEVCILGPIAGLWRSFPMPGYPEITLEFFAGARLRNTLNAFQPDLIHIATEGPLGWSMRRLCLKHKLPFTTSYHSRFPEYMAARISKNHPPHAGGSKSLCDFGEGSIETPSPAKTKALSCNTKFLLPLPQGERGSFFPSIILAKIIKHIAYALLRRFHKPSSAVMVATESMEKELRQRGFQRLVLWPRGIDAAMFRPYGKDFPFYADLPRPILLTVGRVAQEKNLPVFLGLKTPGSKVVIGDGPALPQLKARFPEAHFLGAFEGETLARAYAAADLFVFPSTSDTFGLVLLEACASGLRIAAYPAPGPVDLFSNEAAQSFAALDWDLQKAVNQALALPDDPSAPRRFAEGFSWAVCTEEFLKHCH